MCHDREDCHLKHLRPFGDRISVDIDGLDSDLLEILNMLVAKKSERGDDDQESGRVCEQWDPEPQRFPHSAPSLKQNVFFALEQGPREL